MHADRRHALATLAGAAFGALAAPARAADWPTKPVTIVVAYPAGGDSDAVARLYAEKLAPRIGQTVLVDNRPGASGMIGSKSVARAAADGHTLLFAPSTFAIAQHVLKPAPAVAHDVNADFTPVIQTGSIPLLVVTAPQTGLRTMAQVIAEARGGRALTYGTPGGGSPMHIAAEMLNRAAGVSITHVPYRGIAPVVTDTLGGHVAVGWITPGAVSSHLETGKLVALAVAEARRTKLLPNVPTLVELGYRDVVVGAWMGLLGPRGLPAPVVTALNRHLNEILREPDVQARMQALGIEPVGGAPSVLAKQVADDEKRFGRLVKELDIKAE